MEEIEEKIKQLIKKYNEKNDRLKILENQIELREDQAKQLEINKKKFDKDSGFYKDLDEDIKKIEEEKEKIYRIKESEREKYNKEFNDEKIEIIKELKLNLKLIDDNRNNEIINNGNINELINKKNEVQKEIDENIEYQNNVKKLEDLNFKISLLKLLDGKAPANRYLTIKDKIAEVEKFNFNDIEKLNNKIFFGKVYDKIFKEENNKKIEEKVSEEQKEEKKKTIKKIKKCNNKKYRMSKNSKTQIKSKKKNNRETLKEKISKIFEKDEIQKEDADASVTNENDIKQMNMDEILNLNKTENKSKIKNIFIIESTNQISITYEENGRETTRNIEDNITDILENKEEIFENNKIDYILEALDLSNFEKASTKKKINPVIVRALEEDRDSSRRIQAYVEAMAYKEKNYDKYKIVHLTQDSILKGKDKKDMIRYLKAEEKYMNTIVGKKPSFFTRLFARFNNVPRLNSGDYENENNDENNVERVDKNSNLDNIKVNKEVQNNLNNVSKNSNEITKDDKKENNDDFIK